ncbi:MAG: hypothetical protein GY716_05315, partial [bacterium]|nr:hypothetical protein [bacterium]
MKLTKREKVAITIAAIWMLTAFLVGGALGASTHTCDPLPACTAEECKPFAACVDEKAALGACRGDKAATVERIERRLTDMEAICRARGTSCPQPYVEGDAGMSVGVARGVPLGHTEPTWIVSCKQLEHGCEPERCPP